jgi:hypothetical protein
MAEVREFKTESKRLLELMINSIYTNREIFLRELISNASDAIDKYHFLSLTNDKLEKRDFQIFLEIDKSKRLLKITDNGIGMTYEELNDSLGTIAKSGSFEFMQKLKESEKDQIDVIGQFGVGFYSAFMVAGLVEVYTKSPFSDKGYYFKSTGEDTYEIEEKEGLYQISFRAKQGVSRGVYTTRKVLINGEVPFDEALNTKYKFSRDWKIMTLGGFDETGKEIPYYFHLNAGKNTITMEATLGDYSSLVSRVNTVIDELNRVYRRIIAVTTLNPDPYIDYYLVENLADFVSVYYEDGKSIVGLKETFAKCAKELRDVNRILAELSGGKSDMTASLDRMALQLDSFVNNVRTIQRRLKDYSNNISALGTWILQISEQSIVVDQLFIHSDKSSLSRKNALPKANPNFFAGSWFSIKSFFKSFFFDYESIGVTEAKANLPTIQVWFLTSETAGREQANALSNLILDTFDHANVSLKLVAPGVLLPATLAKRGPDVAINVPNGLPINYALRNAIEDISKYEGFYETTGICSADEIARGTCTANVDPEDENRNFQASAMVPYELNGAYYALPNTQSFLVTFYRTDIFNEYEWKRPTLENPWTWEDVIEIIPELQLKNLQFYLPLNT